MGRSKGSAGSFEALPYSPAACLNWSERTPYVTEGGAIGRTGPGLLAFGLAIGALGVPAGAQPADPAFPGVTEHVNRSPAVLVGDHSGSEGSACCTAENTNRSVSEDGRFVVFESDRDDVVVGDTNNQTDVFRYDRETGKVTRVNVTEFGDEAEAGSASFEAGTNPSISADGQWVLFHSSSPTFIPPGRDNVRPEWGQIYLKHMPTGNLTWVTEDPRDTSAFFSDPSYGWAGSISSDGSSVAFASNAFGPDFDEPGAAASGPQLFVFDRSSGTYEWITKPSWYQPTGPDARTQCEWCEPDVPRLSSTGRYVVFIARDFRGPPPGADPLRGTGSQQEANPYRAWIHDRAEGTTALASLSYITNGDEFPVTSRAVDVSGDGTLVVFHSTDDEVAPNDETVDSGVFLRNRTTATTTLVSVRPDGTPFQEANFPSISDSGRFATFEAEHQTWIRDLQDETTKLVSVAADGERGNGQGGRAAISADGTAVAFESGASNLIVDVDPLDQNGGVFLRVPGDEGLVTLKGKVRPQTMPAYWDKAVGLQRAKVQLFRDGQPVGGAVATGLDGTYQIRRITPGAYRLRVTLEDAEWLEASSFRLHPTFDVRHTEMGSEPVWIEVDVDLQKEQTTRNVIFGDAEDLADGGTNLAGNVVHRLDDMAAIFGGIQHYLSWIDEELPLDVESEAFPAPVEIHAFSTSTTGAEYQPGATRILIGEGMSAYASRDAVGDQGPFVEWHEFTHHVEVANSIGQKAGLICQGGTIDGVVIKNHGGYANPSTCDSLQEGLAEFLPTVAYPEIYTVPKWWQPGTYPVGNINLENNHWDAWSVKLGSEGDRALFQREEYGVAALLWDLIDPVADEETTRIVPLDPSDDEVLFTLRDDVAIPVVDLVHLLAEHQVYSVRDLWERLYTDGDIGSPLNDLTVDLDGDGIKDATPLDAPFLMHGFHPVHPDEVRPDHMHYSPHWVTPLNVPGSSPNRAIGRTDSSYPTSASSIRSPRRSADEIPGGTLAIEVLESNGAPAESGYVVIEVKYADGYAETFQVPIPADGQLAPIRLETPPAVAALTVEDMLAALAEDCGEAAGQVTVRAEADGVPSTDEITFDTCEFDRAIVETTEGESAIEATFELPKRTSKLSVKTAKRNAKLIVSGRLLPGSAGDRVVLLLERRKRGAWKTVDRSRAKLGPALDRNGDGITESRYRRVLKRPERGTCRLTAKWRGDANHFGSKRTVRIRC